jgi:hypothetical protein
MDETACSSRIPSSPESNCVPERLWGQPFGGLNYDKKSGTLNVANSDFLTQISVSITKMCVITHILLPI